MSATTPVPSTEQEQRAAWDLLLLDIEYRTEQLRQIKATPLRIEILKLGVATITAAIALLAAVAGGTVWLMHAIGVVP
jgi:hypothetical protein